MTTCCAVNTGSDERASTTCEALNKKPRCRIHNRVVCQVSQGSIFWIQQYGSLRVLHASVELISVIYIFRHLIYSVSG